MAFTMNPLKQAQDDAKTFLEQNNLKPKLFRSSNFSTFFSHIADCFDLIREEPEILLFLSIQWLAICLAYFAWVRILYWIPDDVWNYIATHDNDQKKSYFDLINLILFLWSAVIIVLVSYVLGLCNGAIVAVHNLRNCGQESTIVRALAIANNHIGRIWLFTALDAFITVNRIIARLPKRKSSNTDSVSGELLYYAWKIATLGTVPALINGKGFIDAGNDSILILKKHTAQALGLRLGYSAICWMISIPAYIFCGYYLAHSGFNSHSASWMYHVYTAIGLALVMPMMAIVVLVRPLYLLSVAELYSDTVDTTQETERDLLDGANLRSLLFSWNTWIFLAFTAQIILLIFWGDKLGWVQWLHHLTQQAFAGMK